MANNNRNYHGWSSVEDAKLVEALLNMVNTGGYKADNGFKSGYLQHLENCLKESLPNSGILGKPHIESRIKTIKRDWQVIYDMMHSSGFGYDKANNCVTVTDPGVWADYIKKKPKAAKWRNKELPHYDELCVIFGKDRAHGSRAQTVFQIEEEVDREEQEQQIDDEEMEASYNLPANNSVHVEENSSGRTKKRKRGSETNSLLENFKDAVILFGDRLKESSTELSEGIKLEVDYEKKASLITSELYKITSLSQEERFEAIQKIKSDPNNVNTFWDLKEEERGAWVSFMLRR